MVLLDQLIFIIGEHQNFNFIMALRRFDFLTFGV